MSQDDKIKSIVNKVLKGIDETECGSDDGWWETSTGAYFGERIKKALIKKLIQGLKNG